MRTNWLAASLCLALALPAAAAPSGRQDTRGWVAQAKSKKENPKKAAAEKAAEEKAAAEKAAAEKAAEEKRAEEKRAEEKRAEEKRAEEKRAEEKRAEEKRAEEKRAEEKRAEEKRAEEKRAEEKRAEEKREEEERKKEEDRKKEEEEKKKAKKEEPKLDLPIRYFVYSAVLSGLAYGTGLLSAGPERQLRNPDAGRTRNQTLWLYRRAYYSGLLSNGLYAASGAMAGYAGYKTQGAVREYLTAKAQNAALQPADEDTRWVQAPTAPPLRAGFGVVPGGASLSFELSF
jgi:chemotaxis protein histidine kinase CheA